MELEHNEEAPQTFLVPHSNTKYLDRYDIERINSLKNMQWNPRSNDVNHNNLMIIIRDYTPDIISLDETWLQSTHNFNIKIYQTIRQDRHDGIIRGIVVLVKKNHIKYTP